MTRPQVGAAVAAIIERVAAHYGMSADDIRSERRDAPTVWARHVAMWLARETTCYSLPRLGRLFGARDHSTVLHAVRRIDMMRDADADVLAELDGMLAQIAPICRPLVTDDAAIQLAANLLACAPAARAATGEQLGLLAQALLRRAETDASPKSEETIHA